MSYRNYQRLLRDWSFATLLLLFCSSLNFTYSHSSDGDIPFYCPDDVYIYCGNLHNDLNYYGYPKPKSHYYNIQVYGPYVYKYLDECGRGKIIRKWKITYHYDTYWCEQTIHIKDPYGNSFDPYKHVTWPKDYHAYSCQGSFHPDKMPYGYGWPTAYHSGCSKLGVKYSDKSYSYDPYSHGYSSHYGKKPCKVIYRIWELIDWCKYDQHSHYNSSSTAYKWYYTQKIYIYDQENPTITSCPNDVEIQNGTCEADKVYVKIPKLKATDNCGDVFISYRKVLVSTYTDTYYSPSYGYGGSYYQGDDASGYYYPGKTEVTFKVWDKCGNNVECKFYVKVTFKDNVPPIPVAITSLTASLMQTGPNAGMIVIPAKAYNRSSYDNCTPAELLKFSLKPNTFTCENYGRNELAFIVEDLAGNTDTAFVELIIAANSFECPGGNISGSVMADANLPVTGVQVYVQPEMMEPTNTSGRYMFEQVPKGRVLNIVPFKNDSPNDGVDMFDFVTLMLHLDGTRPIKDPLKLIAADIDNNKIVDYEDLYAMHRIIIGIDREFSSNTSWRFVQEDFQFPADKSALEVDFPENYEIGLYNGGDLEIDFHGIKIGDLGSLPATPDLSENTAAVITLQEQDLKRGENTIIPFSLNETDQFNAAQFTLNYNPEKLVFKEINPGTFREKGVLETFSSEIPGKLSITWYSLVDRQFDPDEVLFEVSFDPLTDGQLSKSLIIEQHVSHPKVLSHYSGERAISLRFKDRSDQAIASLTQNYPNPFSDITRIGFFIPEEGKANIRIESPSGKVLFSREGIFTKGHHEVQVFKDEIPYTGLMIYRLTGDNFTLSKKMILIR